MLGENRPRTQNFLTLGFAPGGHWGPTSSFLGQLLSPGDVGNVSFGKISGCVTHQGGPGIWAQGLFPKGGPTFFSRRKRPRWDFLQGGAHIGRIIRALYGFNTRGIPGGPWVLITVGPRGPGRLEKGVGSPLDGISPGVELNGFGGLNTGLS